VPGARGERQPETAKIGKQLLEGKGIEDFLFPGDGVLYPDQYLNMFAGVAWNLGNVAKWYAILTDGIKRGDTLAYH